MTLSAQHAEPKVWLERAIERRNPAMLQNVDPEDSFIEQRRVLIISSKPSSQDIVSEFLRAMGYTWCSASGWNALAMLERETFEAILLDVVHASIPAEEVILKIKEADPSVARRLLLIGGSGADLKITELIERHHLLHVSQDDLAPRLWTVLQEVTQRGMRGLPTRYLQAARMIFDSMKSPLPDGVRSLGTPIRQFVYEHEGITIDILVETAHGSGRLLLTGQVLSAQPDGALQANLPVLLMSGSKALARTATDKFGEFNMEFEPAVNTGLEIRLLEKLWVSIPLESMPKDEQSPP